MGNTCSMGAKDEECGVEYADSDPTPYLRDSGPGLMVPAAFARQFLPSGNQNLVPLTRLRQKSDILKNKSMRDKGSNGIDSSSDESDWSLTDKRIDIQLPILSTRQITQLIQLQALVRGNFVRKSFLINFSKQQKQLILKVQGIQRKNRTKRNFLKRRIQKIIKIYEARVVEAFLRLRMETLNKNDRLSLGQLQKSNRSSSKLLKKQLDQYKKQNEHLQAQLTQKEKDLEDSQLKLNHEKTRKESIVEALIQTLQKPEESKLPELLQKEMKNIEDKDPQTPLLDGLKIIKEQKSTARYDIQHNIPEKIFIQSPSRKQQPSQSKNKNRESLNSLTSFTDNSTLVLQPLINISIICLEYLVIELAQILPQIQEAYVAAIRNHSDQKKLAKIKHKFITIIEETKLEVIVVHQDEFINFKFDDIQEFETHIQILQQHSPDIERLMHTIQISIEQTFGEDPVELQVRFKNQGITKDMFEKILTKFYATMRFELYHKIQQFWSTQNNRNDDFIPEEKILELAQEISTEEIYQQVFKLYDINYDYEISLQIKKMEFIFLQQQPLNHEFVKYIDCLTEGHNQMLFYIQVPSNQYSIMETNPINSRDLMHGVPTLFQEILNEITQHVEMYERASKVNHPPTDNMVVPVDQVIKELPQEENTIGISRTSDFNSELSLSDLYVSKFKSELKKNGSYNSSIETSPFKQMGKSSAMPVVVPKINLMALKKQPSDYEEDAFKHLNLKDDLLDLKMSRMGRSSISNHSKQYEFESKLVRQGTNRTIGEMGLKVLSGFRTHRQAQQQNYRSLKTTEKRRQRDSLLTNSVGGNEITGFDLPKIDENSNADNSEQE